MIHQSSVQLKGRSSLISLSKNAAEKVAQIFKDSNITADSPIDLGGKEFFRKGEIKNIIILPDIERVATDINRDQFYQEEKKNRERILAQTPEQKSKSTEMFSELYRVSVGEYPTEEVLEKARWIQHKFFTTNKNRTTCDLHLLKPIIPMVVGKRIDIYQKAMFSLAERFVSRDMQLAK